MHDLIVSGGTLIDGTGAQKRIADVAIDEGRISAVGQGLGAARRTLDASGQLVTPGFVDVHTHYDGQATWDPILAPSCWHDVTTLVMGNCGVGFAPVRPGAEEFLIGHDSLNPFSFRPTYKSLQELPADERFTRLRDPEVRKRILAEKGEISDLRIAIIQGLIENGLHRVFPLGDPPNYEPDPSTSIPSRAIRMACSTMRCSNSTGDSS
jgi:N-acyl-D-aspartate/D-glutamate deacylase